MSAMRALGMPAEGRYHRRMQTLLTWLQLCRFAAVFTAMADIFLGYLLTHSEFDSSGDFGLLLGASACLYLAGMVFNDVFDREIDAQERPKRPIPSGRISLGAAVGFGAILVASGLALSWTAGMDSAIVAGLLTACIFLYDGLLKSTVVGPLAMGACRFLNVILGASGGPAVWAMPQLVVAGGLCVYILGVTWFARHEAGTSSRWQLAAAQMTVNGGLVVLMAFVLHWQDDFDRSFRAVLILGAVGANVNFRLLKAVLSPAPAFVQAAIKTMLLSLIVLDASLVFFVQENVLYAMAVVLLLIPATLLGRVLAIT
jgi:hypothetical protein